MTKNSVNLIKSSIQAIDPGFELGYGVLYNTALIGKKGTKKLIKLIRNNDYFNEREPLIKIINVNKIKPSIYKDFHLLKKNNQKNIPNAEYKKMKKYNI